MFAWRRQMGSGRLGRLRARLEAFLVFPLTASWKATRWPKAILIPTTNPFFLPWVLTATRPLHGRPVVPLWYDLYPDAVEASGMAKCQHGDMQSRQSGQNLRSGAAATDNVDGNCAVEVGGWELVFHVGLSRVLGWLHATT